MSVWQSVLGIHWGRVGAMMRRHWYLLRGSWPRIVELIYWPTVNMLLWGFVTRFMATNSSWVASAFGVLLAGVLLWEIVLRSQFGLAISFLEEMWSRNLGHLFVSPLTPTEWILALTLTAMVRTVIGTVPTMLMCWLFFGYDVFALGVPFFGFFLCLMLAGWAIGLMVCSLVIRHGLGAESLVWVSVFLIAPVSCVYYPVASLPAWLQPIAWSLPTTAVFEGMRAIVVEARTDLALMGLAAALGIAWFMVGAWVFARACRRARDEGKILQNSE